MDPVTIGLLAGGGLGLLKGGVLDAQNEKRDRAMQAQIQRYSPWTGMQAQPVKRADPLGSAMQGVTAGGLMGQGMKGLGSGQAAAGEGDAAMPEQTNSGNQYGAANMSMAPGNPNDPYDLATWFKMQQGRQQYG